MVMSKRQGVRHSLILVSPTHNGGKFKSEPFQFYLSCLPTPLLPISNAEFTQFALKRMTGENTSFYHTSHKTKGTAAKEMVKAMPHRNRGQLRELCGYFSQMSKYDDKLLQQAGKHITRVKSDLMGDGSNGVFSPLFSRTFRFSLSLRKPLKVSCVNSSGSSNEKKSEQFWILVPFQRHGNELTLTDTGCLFYLPLWTHMLDLASWIPT